MITANIDEYIKHLLSAQTLALFAGRAVVDGNKVLKLKPIAVVALQSAFLKEVSTRLEATMIVGRGQQLGHFLSVLGAVAITHILFEKIIEVFGSDLSGLNNEDLKVIISETIGVLIQQSILPTV